MKHIRRLLAATGEQEDDEVVEVDPEALFEQEVGTDGLPLWSSKSLPWLELVITGGP